MTLKLAIIPTDLLEPYVSVFDPAVKLGFESLYDSELSIDNFSFYTSVSAVFSSKIEGEKIELDSFIKHKRFGIEYLPDYTQKIDDLYEAYQFAQKNKLSPQSLELAHAKLTKHILKKSQQGKIRVSNMFVITDDGKIEYVAATPDKVSLEMAKFYGDLNVLISTQLSFEEIFFFASMLHLVFVKIHPFDDGNGRTARLLEKWFLFQKLGDKAWFVESEKNYYDNHQLYYDNIRRLGLDYEELNYKEALSFLQMLPNAISSKK
ncbi:MAG: Fic family protein [Flavobacterium sp.]